MAYEKPKLSFNQIDKAGRTLLDGPKNWDAYFESADAILDWRAAHSYPLNALHMTLRNRTLKIDPKGFTAQRLKRYESIIRKLNRNPTMQMSQMQDVGGCRAVVENIYDLFSLVELYGNRKLTSTISGGKNYIDEPKDDGYRGIHFMYRYKGKAYSSPWDKLRIELQLRTVLQHSWATAVETVDAFTREDLKFGMGSDDWRRFFALVGSMHANYETTAPVPDTPDSEKELQREIADLERRLRVVNFLDACAGVTQHILGRNNYRYSVYVLELKPEERKTIIYRYTETQRDKADTKSAELEKQHKKSSNLVVQVSAHSLSELKRAYPNYFADTRYFVSTLTSFLKNPL